MQMKGGYYEGDSYYYHYSDYVTSAFVLCDFLYFLYDIVLTCILHSGSKR